MATIKEISKAVFAGIFLWSGFAPLEWWIGPYLGAALLFMTLTDQEIKKRLFLSFIAGLSFFLPLLSWSGKYVGAIPWLALAILESLLFALIALRSFRRDVPSSLAFAALFTFIELVRMKFPFGGFGWGRLGFTQVEPLGSLYPVIGISGITFIVSLLSTLIVSRLFRFLTCLFGFMILLTFVPQTIEPSSSIKIDAVQGGVDSLGLDFNSRAFSVLSRHVEETSKIREPGDLIIWPENSADVDPIRDPQASRLVQSTIAKTRRPLLVGAVEYSPRGPQNSSLLFGSNGDLISRYIKQDLTPFGEYIPLRKFSEMISPYAKRVVDFQPGYGWVEHRINGMNFPSLICFEVLDDDSLAKGLLGSDFVVLQTNNATFGGTSQASQQLQISRARAAEFHREFAVVSTTGWTAHINSKGRVLEKLPQYEPGHLAMTVQGYSGNTRAAHLDSRIWLLLTGIGSFARKRNI